MRPEVVHFSAASRPYKLSISHCTASDCPCTFVTFKFKATKDELEPAIEGSETYGPAAFEIDVDAVTWQEHDPRPDRPAAETAMAREFLRDYPRSERQALKERMESKQRSANRLLDYRIDPRQINIMLAYSQVVSEHGSVMTGGKSISFTFEHESTKYAAEDMYCPNPQCQCRRAQICFFQLLPGTTPDDPGRAVQFFDASVPFATGKPKVDKCIRSTPEEAANVLAAWWEGNAGLLDDLKERYEKMKEVGLRSLAVGRKRAVQPRRPGASRWVDIDPPEADEFSPPQRLTPVRAEATPGRNEKCPCGSGKKYKKCCGR